MMLNRCNGSECCEPTCSFYGQNTGVKGQGFFPLSKKLTKTNYIPVQTIIEPLLNHQ